MGSNWNLSSQKWTNEWTLCVCTHTGISKCSVLYFNSSYEPLKILLCVSMCVLQNLMNKVLPNVSKWGSNFLRIINKWYFCIVFLFEFYSGSSEKTRKTIDSSTNLFIYSLTCSFTYCPCYEDTEMNKTVMVSSSGEHIL